VLIQQGEDGFDGDWRKAAPFAVSVIEHEAKQNIPAFTTAPGPFYRAQVGIKPEEVNGIRFDP
jgi:hypothetical protein